MWKTSCIIPVPKIKQPRVPNDFRPIGLTSQVMKSLERLVLHHLRTQVQQTQDPLQFAYREKRGVEDAVLYLLHRTYSYLEEGGCSVRILFFDFSCAFNTIQPSLLQEKLISWIADYLTDRPQFVRIGSSISNTTTSSTGAPQGIVLSPILFTLYNVDFKHNSELCHMQKFLDYTAVVACIKGNEEGEYRKVVRDFVEWCQKNQLILNTSKIKEIVLDFRRQPPTTLPICIKGEAVEIVPSYKYLGLTVDNKLDWTLNTDYIYKKSQSRLYFLQRLASFNICTKLIQMFYNSAVASVLFFAVASWGSSGSKRCKQGMNKLIKKAGYVVGPIAGLCRGGNGAEDTV